MPAFVSKRAIVHLDVNGTPTQIGEVRSFNIETSLGTIDVSTLATNWKNFLVGQASWSGTLEIFYDPTNEAQEALVSNALSGVECSFTFLPFDANERYQLKLGGATGGTFTLGDGDTIETSALNHDAGASAIASALNTAYSETEITAVWGEDGALIIEFPVGVEANLQIMDDLLTGGAGASIHMITERYEGVGSVTAWSVSGATEDAVGVSVSVQGNGELTLNA